MSRWVGWILLLTAAALFFTGVGQLFTPSSFSGDGAAPPGPVRPWYMSVAVLGAGAALALLGTWLLRWRRRRSDRGAG